MEASIETKSPITIIQLFLLSYKSLLKKLRHSYHQKQKPLVTDQVFLLFSKLPRNLTTIRIVQKVALIHLFVLRFRMERCKDPLEKLNQRFPIHHNVPFGCI